MRRTVELVCHAALTDGFHRELCLNATACPSSRRTWPSSVGHDYGGATRGTGHCMGLRHAGDIPSESFVLRCALSGWARRGRKPSAWDSASLCSRKGDSKLRYNCRFWGGWMGGSVGG
jgi:hypothetical protein